MYAHLSALALAVVLLTSTRSAYAQASLFTVDTTADVVTGGICDETVAADCSLRDALTFAELGDTVRFDATRFTSAAPGVIVVTSPLPPLSAGTVTLVAADYRAVVIDGTNAGPDASGLVITSGGNVVAGITLRNFARHGLDVLGGAANRIGGIANNPPYADRNLYTGNGGYGLVLSGNTITDTYLGSNTVGGAPAQGNRTGGVLIEAGVLRTTVGTDIVGPDIAGNTGHGLTIKGPNTSNVLLNTITIGRQGQPNTGDGLHVDGASDIRSQPGLGSFFFIAYNGRDGVRVVSGDKVRFFFYIAGGYGAFIANNGGLGINLVGANDPASGVTPNDAGDADTGPNGLLDFPVITAVTPNGGGNATITGTACAGCTVIAGLTDADPSGHGEFAARLGQATANAQGAFTLSAAVPGGSSVSAIAIDGQGNMSELAASVAGPKVLIIDSRADTVTSACTTAANDCTLRGALTVLGTGDVIRFDATVFPNNGTGVIAVSGPLPTISADFVVIESDYRNVIIDGTDAGANTDGLTVSGRGNVIAGLTVRSFGGDGMVVTGATNRIGGSANNPPYADRNQLIGNGRYGLVMSGATVTDTTVLTNTIGGAAAAANRAGGMLIEAGVVRTTIGTDIIGPDIVGNVGHGLTIKGTATSNVLINTITIGRAGQGNTGDGLYVDGASDIRSQVSAGAFFSITHNGRDGVRVVSGDRVRFFFYIQGGYSATIANNVGLGVNLVGANDPASGVTPNDAGDADVGPNGLLNFPVITAVTPSGGGNATITGTACANCTVLAFTTDGDASGHGEPAGRLGQVTANAQGAFSLAAAVPGGSAVSAFAVDPQGNMSELSLAVAGPKVLTVDSRADTVTSECTSAANDCTLRGALSVLGTGDVIRFDATQFPSNGAGVINVTSALPPIAARFVVIESDYRNVIIDGTNAGASTDGLVVTDGGNVIAGLTIRNFGGDGLVLTGGANNRLGGRANNPPYADRNQMTGNGGYGLVLSGATVTDTSVMTNTIGGAGALGNKAGGMLVDDGVLRTTVGTDIIGPDIAGNIGHGLTIRGATTTDVLLNTITLGRSGQGNTLDGLHIDGATNVRSEPVGAFFHIDHNGRDGIRVVNGDKVRFHYVIQGGYSASVSNNGGLALNLVAAGDPATGVTLNDPNDVDDGPNALLNFPIVRSIASLAGNNYRVRGRACPGCLVILGLAQTDPSGYGELGSPIGRATADTLGVWQADVNVGAVNVSSAVSVQALQPSTQRASELGKTANVLEFLAIVDVCGNGDTEPSEECDDGDVDSGDGCSAVCTRESCGDGVIQVGLGEACDGAYDDGNGCRVDERCSATCAIVAGSPKDCSDGSACTTDSCRGTTGICDATPVTCGANQVCDPAAGCVTCYDSAAGGADLGCGGATPSCVDGGCVACDDDAQCASGECADDNRCECVDGRFGSGCAPCPGGVGAEQCSGQGVCADGLGGTGQCACEPGYAGADCALTCPGFDGSPTSVCGGEGTCTSVGGCACDLGFYIAGSVVDDLETNVQSGDGEGAGVCSATVCGDGQLVGVEGCDDGNAALDDACPSGAVGGCRSARCGDGFVRRASLSPGQPGYEACDAGALNSDTVADRCRTSCVLPRCGDSVVDGGEQCDLGAGNVVGGLCSPSCVAARCGDAACNGSETTATCPGDCGTRCGDAACNGSEGTANCPADCGSRCGDGVANGAEVCDGAALLDETCVAQGFDEGALACAADCSTLVTAGCARCGDAACNGSETTATCPGDCGTRCGDAACNGSETTVTCPDDCGSRCGDGVANGAEACDGAALLDETCVSQGFDEGALACAADCSTLVTTGCARCGDAACNGSETTATCPDDCGTRCGDAACNGSEGTANCPADCGSRCGDGVANGAEVCDGAALLDETCVAQGFDEGALACAADCSALVTTGCARCGDAACNGSETTATCPGDCGTRCGDAACNGSETTVTCPDDCGSRCGDGVANGAEACDGAALLDETCVAQGFDEGVLACAADCSALVTTGCARCGDAACNVSETTATCPGDCGTRCGDAACNGSETTVTCPDDCGSRCGDGVANGAEACDGAALLDETCVAQGFDEGVLACAADCSALVTTGCTRCGDGVANGSEACDGVDLADATCASEGFDSGVLTCATCALVTTGCASCGDALCGASESAGTCPGDCPGRCGDLIASHGEACDGATGCTALCGPADGWVCAAGVCVESCGDGDVDTNEACDDGDLEAGDGCTAVCVIEDGYTCDPLCAPTCGDERLVGDEACERDTIGCDATCEPAAGWLCVAGVCAPECGDGATIAPETCDDGDVDPGDGCASDCTLEDGFTCTGTPSVCTPGVECGDGDVGAGETCDDANDAAGDGCADCTIEAGWECTAQGCVERDDDGDGAIDRVDVCPEIADPDQADSDGDGIGDACDDTNTFKASGAGCQGGPSVAGLLLALGLLLCARRRAVR